MSNQRAVVIPFGVPDDGIGLGLGLAAFVHAYAEIGGESVALAQLLASKRDSGDSDEGQASIEPRPVEAFITSQIWKDLSGPEAPHPGLRFVLTGSFEPPTDGRGHLHMIAFDAKDGRTCASVEVAVDADGAGDAVLRALDELLAQLGGQLTAARDIAELSWDALESVLRAERSVLHDPHRGGPHDRLAAMMHLGRAICDAPDARYPASRLAALALEIASDLPPDARFVAAARRAVVRAAEDAPGRAELLEALAAFAVRSGEAEEAERRALGALAVEPSRARIYALLSEARRTRGDLAGALDAIEQGLLHDAACPLLNTERGLVLAERGDPARAEEAWRMVLDTRPLYWPAFTHLAALVQERKDADAGTRLVDEVLGRAPFGGLHPEVLRGALRLVLAVEPDGLARASRAATLAEALVARAPNDAWALLVLARAHVQLGNEGAAVRRLVQLDCVAKNSRFSAEGQRLRLAVERPRAALELDAVLRASASAPRAELDNIAARARSLAMEHEAWHAFLALGIALRRLERWRAARDALLEAVALAPGANDAHAELSSAYLALGQPDLALQHARLGCALDEGSARSLAILATALLAAGRREEARDAIDRALAIDVTDEGTRAIKDRIHAEAPKRPSALYRLRGVLETLRGT